MRPDFNQYTKTSEQFYENRGSTLKAYITCQKKKSRSNPSTRIPPTNFFP